MNGDPQVTAEPATEPRVRYVVLRHVQNEGQHFDLMVENGPALATWKCPSPPELATDAGTTCIRLPDHRRIYLDYEGPIFSNRGQVEQYDAGTCRIDQCDESEWNLDFDGRKL